MIFQPNRVLYAFGLREFDMNAEALVQYNAAIALEPDHIEARWQRAGRYPVLRLGQFGEELERFRATLESSTTPLFRAGAELARKDIHQQKRSGRAENLKGQNQFLIYADGRASATPS